VSKEVNKDCVEVIQIGSVTLLNIDLTGLSPLEVAKRTAGNLALRKILNEWDGLSEKFEALKTRFLMHEAATGQTKEDIVAQFEECNCHMKELGNKARLLASHIGKDGRSDQSDASVWESLNILQDEVDQGKEEIKLAWEELEKISSSSEKEDVPMIGRNLGKLAGACKKSMVAINKRLIQVELKVTKMLSEG
jgi:hypothetical protein